MFSELIHGPLRGLDTISSAQVTQEVAEILCQADVVWHTEQNACATKQPRGLNKQNKQIGSPYKQHVEEGEGME